MRKQHVLSELRSKYPRKKIICIPNREPKEILCELEPTSNHPEYSIAIAVIEQSIEHYHKLTTETYQVLKGTLTLTANQTQIKLNCGEYFTIPPNTIHSAKGNNAWVKVTSKPGWTQEDHIINAN